MIADPLLLGHLEDHALVRHAPSTGRGDRALDAGLGAENRVGHQIEGDRRVRRTVGDEFDRPRAGQLVERVTVGFVHAGQDARRPLARGTPRERLVREDAAGRKVDDRLKRHREREVDRRRAFRAQPRRRLRAHSAATLHAFQFRLPVRVPHRELASAQVRFNRIHYEISSVFGQTEETASVWRDKKKGPRYHRGPEV